MRFYRPLHIGAKILRFSQSYDLPLTNGKYAEFFLVTVFQEIECNGALAIRERQDIFYRAPGSASAEPRPVTSTAEQSRTFTPTEPVFFRYSALTFNAYHPHCDPAYAREIEGYDLLVVHGQKQATLLYDFSHDLRGQTLARFSFRSDAPIIGKAPLELCAKNADNGLALWTAGANGGLAMTAEAVW